MSNRAKKIKTSRNHNRSSGCCRYSQKQRSKEKTDYEAQCDHKGCKSGTPSFCHSCGTLNIGSHRATAQSSSSYCAQSITQHDLLHIWNTSILSDESSICHHTNTSSKTVEYIKEKHGNHTNPKVRCQQIIP